MSDFSTFELTSTKLLIKFRWLAFFVSIILVVLAATGLEKAKMDPDPRTFFSKDNEHLARFDQLEARYGRVDTVMFAFQIREGELFSRENLTLLKEFTVENSFQSLHPAHGL